VATEALSAVLFYSARVYALARGAGLTKGNSVHSG